MKIINLLVYLSITIIHLFSNVYSQEFKNIRVRSIEREVNSHLGSGVYIGISDPNLKRDDAIAQSIQRAYITFFLFNNAKVKAISLEKNHNIYSEVSLSYDYDLFIHEKLYRYHIEGLNSKSFLILRHLIIRETGECITLIAKEEQLGEEYRYKGVVENTISYQFINDSVKQNIIFAYNFESDLYKETYKYDYSTNAIEVNYRFAHTGGEKEIKASKVSAYSNTIDEKVSLSSSNHTANLSYGLWNAFLRCFINDAFAIYSLKSLTSLQSDDSYTKIKGITKYGSQYKIEKATLRGMYFSQFGLTLDVVFSKSE